MPAAAGILFFASRISDSRTGRDDMRAEKNDGFHADRAADRRGHHRHHRGDRGARPASRPHRRQRSVGHRLASRRQQREPQLDDQLRGGRGYAASMAALGVPPSSGGQPFISPDLSATGTITKSGYDITYAASASQTGGSDDVLDGHGGFAGLRRAGGPLDGERHGRAHFGTNEGAALFEDVGRVRSGRVRRIPGPRPDERHGDQVRLEDGVRPIIRVACWQSAPRA